MHACIIFHISVGLSFTQKRHREGDLSASVCEYKGIFVQVARIVIHDGDNGADLASSFCKQYKLDDGTCKKSLHRKFKLNPVFLKMDPRISLCLTH
jgi:hypothetical protein